MDSDKDGRLLNYVISTLLVSLRPGGQMCRRERARTANVRWKVCRVRMSPLYLRLLFLLSSENKRVNSGQTMSPERRRVFWCATRFGQCTVKPITPWLTPLGFDSRPRCRCHDNPLLCLLYWCNSPQMLCWKQINSPGGHELSLGIKL